MAALTRGWALTGPFQGRCRAVVRKVLQRGRLCTEGGLHVAGGDSPQTAELQKRPGWRRCAVGTGRRGVFSGGRVRLGTWA